MSVINTKYEDHCGAHDKFTCDACNGKLDFPFVFWYGARSLRVCGRCCQESKEGLMADVIQVAATWDLRDCLHGPSLILVRDGRQRLEEAGEKEEMETNAIVPLKIKKNEERS
jgi:hypothetical protein